MTQTTFAAGENPVTSSKLNQAVQGYRFLRRSIFSSLSEPFVHRCHPEAEALLARLIGPGGGGGGANVTFAGQSAAGGGGGAGGYSEKLLISSTLISRPFTILAPSGGPGGLGSSPGVAVSSGAAILYAGIGVNIITLVSAIAGAGGGFMNQGTLISFSGGGFGGFGFLGDLGMTGERGGVAIRFPGPVGISGRGGKSIYGGGGVEVAKAGPGDSGDSYGSGGSGAVANGPGMFSGGNGGPSLVLMDEFY